MYVSCDAHSPAPTITANWHRDKHSERERLFLSFGANLTLILSTEELMQLDKVIAGAFDDGPLSLDQAPKQAQQ
jgi:hypothetical protein